MVRSQQTQTNIFQQASAGNRTRITSSPVSSSPTTVYTTQDELKVKAVGLVDNTELSHIEHRRILGRRAINCDCPRHSFAVLLICDFANSRTYGVARDRGLCTHESRDHLEERWLAAWLFRSWFCTDDKSAKMCSRFCHRQKDAGGRACADRFSYQITVPETVGRRCESLII